MRTSAMLLHALFTAALLASLFGGSSGEDSINSWDVLESPPYFTHEPNPSILYFEMESGNTDDESSSSEISMEKNIRCSAGGVPEPIYRWKKDNQPFDYSVYGDRVKQLIGEGTLIFNEFMKSDAGVYVCEASNANGTAVDRPVILEEIYIHHFPMTDPEVKQVELGEPFQRNCVAPPSNPKARTFWTLKGRESGQFRDLTNNHISTDDDGTLYFHYVNFTDVQEKVFYTCSAVNGPLKDYKFGDQFSLQITTNKMSKLDKMVSPKKLYIEPTSSIALLGATHKLHCFVSGFPVPQPKWYHNNSNSPISVENAPTLGYRFENFGKTLVFNATQDKAGIYYCKFHNSNIDDGEFLVPVQAAPYWNTSPPSNRNTSVGESVTFECNAEGNPRPTVSFYKNGIPLFSTSKYNIEGNHLTLTDVQRGENGMGENAVYQCSAANVHGSIWANFYLNILSIAPRLLEAPDEVAAELGEDVELSCAFLASPAATISWINNNGGYTLGFIEEANLEDYGRSKANIPFKNVSEANYGDYTCTASNRYGNTTHTIRLVPKSFLSRYWSWLLLALVLILALLILCCLLCIFARRKATVYPVSQRERERGNKLNLPSHNFTHPTFLEVAKKRSLSASELDQGENCDVEASNVTKKADERSSFPHDGVFVGYQRRPGVSDSLDL